MAEGYGGVGGLADGSWEFMARQGASERDSAGQGWTVQAAAGEDGVCGGGRFEKPAGAAGLSAGLPASSGGSTIGLDFYFREDTHETQ